MVTKIIKGNETLKELITRSLGKNPRNGGSPPRDIIVTKRINLNTVEFEEIFKVVEMVKADDAHRIVNKGIEIKM